MIKLTPVFKNYIWGGKKLAKIYGNDFGDNIAEAWILACHPDGQNLVDGAMLFSEYLSKEKISISKTLKFNKSNLMSFPILIKLIDAKENLSIQVHPDDDFALKHENSNGKTEMWHIIDCDKDAYIYYGFCKNVTMEEFQESILNNYLLDLLNKVIVKPGDTILVEPGTLHAIGKGITLCEVQQNSNITYRVYDYGRLDKNGNLRPLHIEKAKQVVNLNKTEIKSLKVGTKNYQGYKTSSLSKCKYFNCELIHVDSDYNLKANPNSFTSIVILQGNAKIFDECDGCYRKFKLGDSIFLNPTDTPVNISGKCKIIVTTLP